MGLFSGKRSEKGHKGKGRPVRYAVVGAGHIAQNAVLPAFANARRNSELTAIISGDADKRRKLKKMYKIDHVLDYEGFDDACRSDIFDAVYIALPNNLHCDYTCRAAAAGIHILCEKPMAVTSDECRRMVEAVRSAGVKLMIAYRLHFEEANLKAAETAQRGKLGMLRFMHSIFSMQVRPDNIRVEAEMGGGPLYDLGIYCINAARYLFSEEPVEVTGFMSPGSDPRFSEVEETISAILRFPGDRLASFTCSFGAADASHYELVGTKGSLRVDPAYEYEGELRHVLKTGDRTRERTFSARDQFAPELLYFSDCILSAKEPEPGGEEGLIDVRIIEAIFESIRHGRTVTLGALPREPKVAPGQEIHRRKSRKKKLVNAESAHAE